MGSWAPFIGVFYRQMRLTGLELGVLFAIPSVCIALLGPVWGWVADRLGGHRAALRLSVIPAALAALLVSQAASFAELWPRVVLFGLFFAPAASLMDGIGVSVSQRAAIGFGRLRMWGSLGYIATSSLVGAWLGGKVTGGFLAVQATCLLLLAAVSLGFPAIGERHGPQHAPVNITVILHNRPLFILLLTQAVLYLANTAVLNYVGIFMASLGAPPRLIGLAVSLMAVSEVPILLASSQLTRRVSARRMLMLSIGVYVVRFALLSLVRTPVWVLPVQLLNGVGFGLYALSAPRLAHELAGGEALAATAQSLLASAAAMGGITGTLIAGVLLDRIATYQIFMVMSGVALLAFLIFGVGWRLAGRKRPAPSPAATLQT